MKRASSNLFDLVYGELMPLESKIFGKMCFLFYDESGEEPQILYYPSTKEIKTLRSLEIEFSQFIPLNTDDFRELISNWMETKYSKEMLFKGIDYIEFVPKILY